MSNGKPAGFGELEDNEVLLVFSSMIDNAKQIVKRHPASFYQKFVKFGTDLNRFSRHINCDGLRKVYFHIAFMQNPLRESLNYDLRNRVLNAIDQKELQLGETRQVVRSAATNLTVSCLSDIDGREVIDIEQFREDIGLPEESNDEKGSFTASKVLSALDSIFDEFVDDHSNRMIDFLEEIQASCRRSFERNENKWYPVLATTSNIAIELDKKAISWQRSNIK